MEASSVIRNIKNWFLGFMCHISAWLMHRKKPMRFPALIFSLPGKSTSYFAWRPSIDQDIKNWSFRNRIPLPNGTYLGLYFRYRYPALSVRESRRQHVSRLRKSSRICCNVLRNIRLPFPSWMLLILSEGEVSITKFKNERLRFTSLWIRDWRKSMVPTWDSEILVICFRHIEFVPHWQWKDIYQDLINKN